MAFPNGFLGRYSTVSRRKTHAAISTGKKRVSLLFFLVETVFVLVIFRAPIINATHELVVVGTSNVPGKRRRRPVDRLWSGSDGWDAPVRESGLGERP